MEQSGIKLKVFCLLVSFLLLGILPVILAQQEVELVQDVPFSFSSWFQHVFGIQDFSIVGDYRQCDRYPKRTFTYEYGDPMYVDASDYCNSGYGLINFFTGGWNPVAENKDRISISSCNVPPCNIEVYCCPHDECDRDRDCEIWYGSGSDCKTEIADDPNIDYQYSTFNYCTEPSGIEVTCWYYPDSGESCFSRTYIGDEECPPTYMGYRLYESKSICEGNIPNGNGNGEELPGEEPTCRNKEEIFYTNAEGKQELKGWLIGGEKEITPQIIDFYILGFSGKYFEDKGDACCEDLEYVYVDSKEKEITPVSILMGIIGSIKVTFTYDVYKCVPEGEAGFCLEFAHKWLNPYTHTDNCQTNTIIFISACVLLLLLLTFPKGKKK